MIAIGWLSFAVFLQVNGGRYYTVARTFEAIINHETNGSNPPQLQRR